MSRIVYLNGAWLPEEEARISVFDRGFLFADAVYEVTSILHGKLLDFPGHAARLSHSVAALGISMPVGRKELLTLHQEIARRNGMTDGLVYLQISRGAHDRDFLYPDTLHPTFLMFTQAKNLLANPKWQTGMALCTAPEGRWANRQIKTVQLLYSSQAKMQAHDNGFDDVVFVEDGLITEASSANFHIVTADGALVTRGLSNALLHGITRASVLDIARKTGMMVEERAFSPADAAQASEAFISSASNFITPVISIDGQIIGDGIPGPISQKLRELYIEERLADGIAVG